MEVHGRIEWDEQNYQTSCHCEKQTESKEMFCPEASSLDPLLTMRSSKIHLTPNSHRAHEPHTEPHHPHQRESR
ncbi:hypothetical protein XELAEV_18044203mg [Xenopus laevis]|uniref:Uncharacterized protein n=1 Tax=Xenopus laevis TaxID=8355 RepID=A0A974H325_XENLA|nr:hypothetical protein XELAEV_18044203mg [Xenopus laevis]